ncbi:MAG: beta-propeller fold lactonase family protein [Xanthomonadales bacterium]|nr:beta-propeller fold lactonase family protein [Xanthomonadales bacterium]
MYSRIILLLALVVGVTSTSTRAQVNLPERARADVGAVYTMSNAANGNQILVYDRFPNGRLQAAGSVYSGGNGSGGGLGNQGALRLTQDQGWLLAVNAGSDSVSVLQIRERGLLRIDTADSGGSRPVSVTEHGGLVYVLNAGSDSIAGFRLSRTGRLQPLAGSSRLLSTTGTGPAQIGFSPDGRQLVVTEKATSRILSFPVDAFGLPGEAVVTESNGMTPFGFTFGKRNQLFVSEAFGGAADASATSAYRLGEDGSLETIVASAPTNQTANCWVELTPNGRYAYVTNTGSGTISGYSVGFDGALSLLDDNGVTASTGGRPIDIALSGNGQFIYALVGGSQQIVGFRIQPNGGLIPLAAVDFIPEGANGLAAR